jgi:hypothetical protein
LGNKELILIRDRAAIRVMKSSKKRRIRRIMRIIKRNHSQAGLQEKMRVKRRNRIKNTKINSSARTKNSRNTQQTILCYSLNSPL